LHALAIVVLDGKVVKRVPKRLRPLRGCPGGVLGGKALAALNLRNHLALALATHPDGHTNEAKLVPAILPQVRAHAQAVLWVADAQFGNPTQIAAFTARPGDHVVVRSDGKSQFVVDDRRPPRSGRDRNGRRYEECWGWLGGPRNRHRCYVRRVRLQRPGEETVVLFTDLLDADVYPADEVLEVYLRRWGIEHVFQEITEVFQLQHLIGSTPQGTVFQLALCLWWYNLIQVVRAYVAAGAGEAVEQVSSELLFVDVQRQMIALHELLPAAQLVPLLPAPVPAGELRERLERLLHPLWTERWRKAPKKKRPGPHPPRGKRECASAYRLIQRDRLRNHQLTPK
jgi:Transposase DDE domain